jgi:tRNA threonylcarbamoyladenosine biosynthesis protein TsaB
MALPLLLNIDTATEYASVCINDNENIIGIEKSTDQKNHASFIQPAIKKLFYSARRQLSDVDAIAVTAGPGSYTGLRVGLATAKGLCYALNKPLILLNTLEVMGHASLSEMINDNRETANCFFCPMIDARRMEVFTAMYNNKLECILKPAAVILDENMFNQYLSDHRVIFSGSGSLKLEKILHHSNAIFLNAQHSAADMVMLSIKAFGNKHFADIAYSEPFYLKEFFTPVRKV